MATKKAKKTAEPTERKFYAFNVGEQNEWGEGSEVVFAEKLPTKDSLKLTVSDHTGPEAGRVCSDGFSDAIGMSLDDGYIYEITVRKVGPIQQ